MFVCDVVMSILEFCVYIIQKKKNDILPRTKNCFNFALNVTEKNKTEEKIYVSLFNDSYTHKHIAYFNSTKTNKKKLLVLYFFNNVYYHNNYID